MKILNKKINYFLILLLGGFLFQLHAYFEFSQNFGLDGHDTFQYIQFASVVNSDQPYLFFYRPILYWLINIFNFFYGWTPQSYTKFLLLFYILSTVALYFLLGEMLKSENLKYIFLFIFISSNHFVTSFYFHYTTLVESFFVFAFLLFLIKGKNEEKVTYKEYLSGLFAYFGTHVHEDKFIFFTAVIFFYYFINKKKAIKILLTLFFLSLATLIYFAHAGLFLDILGHTYGISKGYQKTNFISDFIFIIDNGLIYILTPKYLLVFYIIILSKFFFNKNKEFSIERVILFGSLVYISALSIAFGKFDLVRVFSPVLFLIPLLCFVYVDKFFIKSSTFLKFIVTSVLIFFPIYSIQNIYLLIDNNKNKISKYKDSYDLINSVILKKRKPEYNYKILQLPSFEARNVMWNGYDAYGLASEIYFGKTASTLMGMRNKSMSDNDLIDHVLKNYNVFVTTNNPQDPMEKKIINNLISKGYSVTKSHVYENLVFFK
jgi:hypothetical protein